MNAAYEFTFLKALTLTTVIELPVLIALTRFVFRISNDRLPWSRLIGAGLFCSFATLPYLWFVLPAWIHTRMQLMIIGELSVAAVETVFYQQLLPVPIGKALLLSVGCNLASFVVGLLVLH